MVCVQNAYRKPIASTAQADHQSIFIFQYCFCLFLGIVLKFHWLIIWKSSLRQLCSTISCFHSIFFWKITWWSYKPTSSFWQGMLPAMQSGISHPLTLSELVLSIRRDNGYSEENKSADRGPFIYWWTSSLQSYRGDRREARAQVYRSTAIQDLRAFSGCPILAFTPIIYQYIRHKAHPISHPISQACLKCTLETTAWWSKTETFPLELSGIYHVEI